MSIVALWATCLYFLNFLCLFETALTFNLFDNCLNFKSFGLVCQASSVHKILSLNMDAFQASSTMFVPLNKC